MSKYYTDEVNAQIILSLLKQHGIRKVIASPGTTNMAITGSIQNDPYFEVYSSVDERSAAYMACGLAHESGEPVVISCTGATASRNYLPGMTEAYYRKLPVLAITSMQSFSKVGHHVAQVIDRSSIPNDVAKISVTLPIVQGDQDSWECEVKVNQAILELKRRGGGPAHINLPTIYSQTYSTKELPVFRKIERFDPDMDLPPLPSGRIAILVGAHSEMMEALTESIDKFCRINNAIVIHDHTSGYHGSRGIHYALIGSQQQLDAAANYPDLVIHIGEVSGDYFGLRDMHAPVWRVSPDGELRDTYGRLKAVFEMGEERFFAHYAQSSREPSDQYYLACKKLEDQIRSKLPELPLSNLWVASVLSDKLPKDCVVHFAILNSLRSWNFFKLPPSVKSISNVGGFGIDGGLSTLIGASLANPSKLYFGVIGDLAFFYDLNVLGNRHVGRNLRILLINNGKGVEFRNFNHVAAGFGVSADRFIAAAGHFGPKSPDLVRSFVQALGFTYMSATTKDELQNSVTAFVDPALGSAPMVLEVFTDSDDESDALEAMTGIERDAKGAAKDLVKSVLKSSGANFLKKIVRQ